MQMFAVFATLALFLAASARVSEVSTARALLTNKRGRKDRCYDYGYECHKDDDCCGCLECHYGYCSQPCVRKGGYCDIYYSYCCEGYYCYGYECVERLPCYPVHYECDRDSDCCEGLECYEGYCYLPCKKEGEFCDDFYHYCCEGFKCKDYCCEEDRKDGRHD